MSLDPYAEIQRLVATLPQSVDTILARAKEWIGGGATDLALDLLRRAAARHPAIPIRLELSRLLHHVGRSRDGLAEVVAVVKEDSGNVDGLLLLAEILASVGEPERARKMLDRARELGAPQGRLLRAEQACFGAPQDEADSTEPGTRVDLPPPGFSGDVDVTPSGLKPPPRTTLLGRPTNEEQGRRALPRISEGGFGALDAYQTMGASPDDSLLQEVPDGLSDGAFDNFLSQIGLPVSTNAEPIYRSDSDYAHPEDMTTGVVISDDLLSPSDETAAIHLPDVDDFATLDVHDKTTMSPSVHVDAALQSPQMPADLDDLPSWDAPAHGFFDEASLRGDVDPGPALPMAMDVPEQSASQWSMNRPGELQLPDESHEADVVYSSKAPVRETSKPVDSPSPAPLAQSASMNPPLSGFGVPSAMPQSNSPAQSAPTVRNRTVVLVIGLAAVVLVMVAALGASGVSESSTAQEMLDQADSERAKDSYVGYKAALERLDKASKASGFLNLSLPGAKGPKLRKRAAAEEAFVAAILDYEFGESITPPVSERISDAPPAEPATQAALSLSLLRTGNVSDALKVAAEARQKFPGNPFVEDADVLAQLAAKNGEGATKAVAAMRGVAEPTVRQRYLAFAVDSLRDNRKAIDALRAFIKENPDHVRAVIALANLLRSDKSENDEARQLLTVALAKTQDVDTAALSAARASIALADVMARTGERERAEDGYRDALRTLSTRWDLYLPLLQYYLSEARFDEVNQYIEKAQKAGTSGPPLQIVDAQYLLRIGKVEEAIQRLLVTPAGTPGRDWWLGMGYADLQRPQEAAAAFAADKSVEGPAAELAMKYLAGDGKADDTDYAIEKMVDAHSDAVNVRWAQAVFSIAAMKAADSRDKRTKFQKQAIKALESGLKLEPSNERLDFMLCEVYLSDRDGDRAQKACLDGRKINPQFPHGALMMARLRRLQGQYKEAKEIIEPGAKQRPEDIRFGLERARIALESHDLDDAQREINRWSGKGIAEFELNLLEGRLAFERTDYAKAAAYLQNAQAMPQGDGEATVFFGITLVRLGRFEEAGPLLLDTLPHPTWSGWGWLYLGELRRLQGRFDDAFENFPKALRDFKGQTGPRSRFSTLYAEWARAFAGRFNWDHPKVVANLELGRDEGDPDDPEINAAFADYYLNRRTPDMEAAARYLNKVVQVAPYRCAAVKQLLSLSKVVEDRRRAELKEISSSNCQ